MFPGNRMRMFPHGPVTWKVMQRSAWKDIANLQTKQRNNFTKSQHPALTTTNSKKKKLDPFTVCSQFVLKCLYLARIGGPDILWSVNKLARAVTKWTKACDKRLARLISYIHHTCGSDNIGLWETQHNNAD